MASHKATKRKREAYYNNRLHEVIKSKCRPCPNCGERTGGCFFPPCFGEPGFYTCKPKRELAEQEAQ